MRDNRTAPRKVTLTALHLMHGGTERVITSLANAFAERGWEVSILCTYRLGEPAYPLSERVGVCYLTDLHPNRAALARAVRAKDPVAILREGLYAVRVLWQKRATMRRALKDVTEGAVISTRHEHSLLLSRVGRGGVLKIAQLHSDHAFDKKLIRSMRRGYRNIDLLPLFTEQTAEEVRGFFAGVSRAPRILCLPHFLATSEFPEGAEKKNQILAAGRLHPDKDFFSLLRIWHRFLQKRQDHTLVIAGEGEEREALVDYADKLGILGFVRFAGALPYEELLSEMAASKAFALTSVSESFGLVLVEALASGCVPVAYDVRVGPRAILSEGETGFLIERGQEEEFADRLLLLAEDEECRRAMEEQGRAAARRYEKDAVMREWIALLEE